MEVEDLGVAYNLKETQECTSRLDLAWDSAPAKVVVDHGRK